MYVYIHEAILKGLPSPPQLHATTAHRETMYNDMIFNKLNLATGDDVRVLELEGRCMNVWVIRT